MYSGILHTHSLLRYFVLAALLLVIIKAAMALAGNKSFGKWDNKFSLYLLIFTHLQLLAGVVLYFTSPWVKFGSTTMSDSDTRYWTVEHIFGMLIAVVLITVARISMKKLPSDQAKHRRLLILNSIALIIIIVVVAMSGRGILTMSTSM